MSAGQEADKRRPSVRCVWHATYGPNLAHIADRGLTSDVQSRITRIPAAPPICFPRDANAPRVLGAGRKCRRAQAPPAGPARQERRPILLGQTCCTLHHPSDGALEASTAAFIDRVWLNGYPDPSQLVRSVRLHLLRSMVPIFRSCLIEDDLMALTPDADGLFQFSI